MGMALDEPTDKDKSYEVEGLSFIVNDYDQAVIEEYGGVEINFSSSYGMSGFSIRLLRGRAC